MDTAAVTAPLPLPTLLSQVLVAFTIEFDNEFESRTPHRTTMFNSEAPPRGSLWLASMVMWSNLMRLVPVEGIPAGKLPALARTNRLSLTGMQRWRYITVAPDPSDPRPKPPARDWLVRPTAKGRLAQEVWRQLSGVIEERWRERFGAGEIEALRDSLAAVVGRLNLELPEYLPVLGYGLTAEVFESAEPTGRASAPSPDPTLPALLSKVLLAFALEFEKESDLSLPICANVIRILDDTGMRLRNLPRLSGVSKEAIATAMSFLRKRGYLAVEPDPAAARTKLVRLTAKGLLAQDAYRRRLILIEKRWETQFGKQALLKLREPLERLVGADAAQASPLFRGLNPPPGCWRAKIPRPETLPHYPMVLHRGGYPDGS